MADYKTYEAADVNEAVAMAERFKAAGKYDWFRGQLRDWPPRSTVCRKNSEGKTGDEDLNMVLVEFAYWAAHTDGLESLVDRRDEIIAVAQHYGLPTTFIDFTTEPGVAGFFACDGKNPSQDGLSCIYCLETADLMSVWEFYRPVLEEQTGGKAAIELIRLTVPNLWRLEAQAGTFLHCSGNWDEIYKMDRIVFPYTGYPTYPPRSEIYPERQSALEILLDGYFARECNRRGMDGLLEVFKRLKERGVNIEPVYIPPDPLHYYADCFVSGGLPELPSWSKESLAPWLRLETELLHTTLGGEIKLAVDLQSEGRKLSRSVTASVTAALRQNADLRQRAVRWHMGKERDASLEDAVSRLWDGLRRLPVSDDNLAEGLGLCVALHQSGLRPETDRAKQIALISKFINDPMEVQFAGKHGGHTNGYVATDQLYAALRSDVREYLRPEHLHRAESVELLLLICKAPERLFDLEKLAHLFTAQIAPTEVLLGTDGAFFYSPARLVIFGLP
jgi:hypothetical protein